MANAADGRLGQSAGRGAGHGARPRRIGQEVVDGRRQRGRIREVMPLVHRARALTEALGHPRLPPMVLHDPSALAFGVGDVPLP